MLNHFVQPLYDAALDIVGDIHGEIDALKSLMKVLGYDGNGQHLAQRNLFLSVTYVIEGWTALQ